MTTSETSNRGETLKAVRAALKRGGRVYLHADKDPNAPEWQSDKAFFTLSVDHAPLTGRRSSVEREDVTRIKGIPGWVRNGSDDTTETVPAKDEPYPMGFRPSYKRYTGVYAPKRGYWSLFANDTFANVIALLPSDAEISFQVRLDWHTSQNHVNASMHGDALYLIAKYKRGKREIEAEFLLDSVAGPHNSARFGNGMGER